VWQPTSTTKSLVNLSEYVDLASMANILGTIESGSIFNHCRVGLQVSSSLAKSLKLAMKTRAHSVVKGGTLANGKLREESAEADGAFSRLERRSSSKSTKGLGRRGVFRLDMSATVSTTRASGPLYSITCTYISRKTDATR
jgi:hypothetical protein